MNLIEENGIIRFEYYRGGGDGWEKSNFYVMVLKDRVPDHLLKVFQPVENIYRCVPDERIENSSLVGAKYSHRDHMDYGTIDRVDNLVSRLAEEFNLWQIPFNPSKNGETTLQTLFKLFDAYLIGERHTLDSLSFNGSIEELEKTLQFCGLK